MSELINQEIFAHLVDLAALQLDAAEADYLRQQLNNQLNAIQELAGIPLDDDVPSNLHGVSYSEANRPALRADVWRPYPHPEDIMGQAPQAEDGYIIVPDIPHTDLE